MKTLILVRHGLTDSLVQGRYQGWSDSEMNEEGRRQIQELAIRFEQEKPEIIFSSPLKRARESAEILLSSKLIVEDDRIKEMCFGEWDGLTYEQIMAKDPGIIEWWKKDMNTFRPAGGESFGEFRKRVKDFYSDIQVGSENVIAVVTHSGVIRIFMIELLNLPLDSFWKTQVDPGSMTIIDMGKENRVRV